MNKWTFLLGQLSKRLWLKASLFAALGVGAALSAAAFSRFVPPALAKPFGGGTVNGLLEVLASSLLGVATFSVAAMLTAYTNVSQSASPRAAALITGDSHAQTALATFVGSFMYAVVAFSANGTGYYGGGGRAIVFFVTLFVLAVVAINLLRWLDQLLSLARVGHTIAQVEKAAAEAIRSSFGRMAPACAAPPPDAQAIYAKSVGYVQNVDLNALDRLAERFDVRIWVNASPGAFAEPSRMLATVQGGAQMQARLHGAVEDAFGIGAERSFPQDPRFGFIVLGQIASKALSPGINDPGTAIDVTVSAVRLLTSWLQADMPAPEEPDKRVHISRPLFDELLRDVFEPVALDGASSLPVSMRLQRALAALARVAGPSERAVIEDFAREAIQRSDKALAFDFDRARVREAAGDLLD